VVKREERLDRKTVRQLVKLYRPGADDAVGPEFRRRGAQARDELIQMLDATPTKELDGATAETISRILQLYFSSDESAAALERLQSRHTGPLRGSGDLLTLTMLRAKLSGQQNEDWRRAHTAKDPWERDVHFCELLLDNARPEHRLAFLVDVAGASLNAYRFAVRDNNPALQSTNAAKAEKYAREILAIPDLAAKSGDGVYEANHVLGVLAADRGDMEAAKYHLIEASKTPGSWRLNRVPGPDWRLALALLERGEREVVCEFLDNVNAFSKWERAPTPTRKDALIERWKEIVRDGGTPEFMEWFDWKAPRRKRKPGTVRGEGSPQEK
jgi:hypothetical protein